MKNNQKYFIRLYMKYTVRRPVLIFMVIGLGLLSLFYLAYTTNIYEYKTLESRVIVEGEVTYLEAFIDSPNLDERIYWYFNKEEEINSTQEYFLAKVDNGYLIRAIPDNRITSLRDGELVFIDVPITKITLWSRIIARGK